MKTPLLLPALALLAAHPLQAAVTFINDYRQDFDELIATRATLPGTDVIGNQVPIPGLDGWQLTRRGGTSTGANITIWPDLSTGGRFYSFGDPDSPDRALGMLGSGAFFGAVGAEFVNTTGTTFTQFTLSFTREIWVVQGTTTANQTEDAIAFAYGLSGSGISSTGYLTSDLMTAVTELDLVSPASNSVTGVENGTTPSRNRDGNSPEWSERVSYTVHGILWDPGDSLFIRWSDSDSPGFDAGMGIDDFHLIAVPEPGTSLLAALGALALFRRRR